jgi:hypothetical protein
VVATEVSVLVVLLVLVTFVWVVLKVQLRFVCVCCGARGSSKSGSAGALCEKWSSEKSIVTNCSAVFIFLLGS